MKKLIMITMLIFINFANADPWHGYTKITHLYPSNDGMIFMVEDPLPEFSACDDGKRFLISINHPNYDVMVSSLLLAYSVGKSIRINLNTISNTTCSPSINRFIFGII